MAVCGPMRLAASLGLFFALLSTRTPAQEVSPELPPRPISAADAEPPPGTPPPSTPPAQTPNGSVSPPSTGQLPVETDEPLPVFLRHLSAVGAAWGAAPSADGNRVGFVTTLFGSRQAAVIPSGGGYPVQLTDEPGGVIGVRFAPHDPHLLFLIALRAGQRRLLLVDDAGGPLHEVDPAPGDQLIGGFTRDGRRMLFASVDGDKVALKWLAVDSRLVTEVVPPLPQAGSPPTPAGQKPLPPLEPLSKSLAGLSALSAPTLDARFTVAQLRKGGDENLVIVDLVSTRAGLLTPHEGTARFRFARYGPDGKTIFTLTDAGRDALAVEAINVADQKRRTLFAPPGEVEAFALADDGHRLVAATVSGGETLFTLLELPSLRQQPLPQPPPGALQAAAQGEPPIVWSRNGERLFFAWGRADDTTDVYMLRADFGSATRLTRSPRPGLGEGTLPRPRSLAYASLDGRQIPALIWLPKKVETSASAAARPLPRAALVLCGCQARPLFDTRIAALAELNVASLQPGVRGSEGRGKAHAAEDAAGALQDAVAAGRWLRSSTELDGAAPLLIGIGAGVSLAIETAKKDPSAFSGLVLVSDRPPPRPHGVTIPVLTLSSHGGSALSELAAFAKRHLERSKSTAAR